MESSTPLCANCGANLSSTHGSGEYLRADMCLVCFAAWYAARVQDQDRHRQAVLPTVPAQLYLNTKVSEGTCRWCQEPIWWRRRHDRKNLYPAAPTADHDRGHRCHKSPQGELGTAAVLLAVLLLGAWAPAEAQGPQQPRSIWGQLLDQQRARWGVQPDYTIAHPIQLPAYGPQTGMDATGRPVQQVPMHGQQGPVLGPVVPDAYGPGVGMAADGRPVVWR